MDKDDILVEAVGVKNKAPVTVSWKGGKGHGKFTPTEPGLYKVSTAVLPLVAWQCTTAILFCIILGYHLCILCVLSVRSVCIICVLYVYSVHSMYALCM